MINKRQPITDLGYEGIRERITKGAPYLSPYKPRAKGREEIAHRIAASPRR